MRIIVGVTELAPTRQTLHLLRALRFPNPDVELVYAIEPLNPLSFSYHGLDANLVDRYMAQQRLVAQDYLKHAQAALTEAHPRPGENGEFLVEAKLLSGFPADTLLATADRSHAGLIMLGSTGKSPFKQVFLGSVSRKVLISAKQSVCLVKHDLDPNCPLTVVFATDHSPYARRCADLLLNLAPRGIGRLVILTVYPDQLGDVVKATLPNFRTDVGPWIQEELGKQNAQLAAKLAPLGIPTSSQVVPGDVNQVINQTMFDEKADLLILGAQGRRFMERFVIGSISHHQATAEPHSVLILRP